MKERFMIKCVVCLLLTKYENNKEYILLQRRYNTGIEDGKYDLSSTGHLEKNETIKDAVVRETKEEIGVTVNPDDLKHVSTTYATFPNGEYVLVAFNTNKYKGTPTIKEPTKCDELLWVDINKLPSNIIENRKNMIDNYKNGNTYDEYGFNKK